MRKKSALPPALQVTRQRKIILEELQRNPTHPTASELYELVRRRLPRISLGTVYRNLEMLCKRGVVQKLEHGGDQKRFDAVTKNHYHLRCILCGQIADAPMKPLTDLETALQPISDYDIIAHRLEFIGLCPKCQKIRIRTRDLLALREMVESGIRSRKERIDG
ncbi:MAG: transcriptional repressor [bacterium]